VGKARAEVKVTPGPGADTLKAIRKLFNHSELKVGVLGGTYKPEGEGEKSLPLPYLAAVHEFGLGVPQRSFIRGYVHEHQKEIQKVIVGAVQSKGPEVAALDLVGMYIVGQIQKRMANRIPPPLAPVTIARKGSDVPLIDTGQLRAGVTYKITTRAQ
jgi:hypothetical protein